MHKCVTARVCVYVGNLETEASVLAVMHEAEELVSGDRKSAVGSSCVEQPSMPVTGGLCGLLS